MNKRGEGWLVICLFIMGLLLIYAWDIIDNKNVEIQDLQTNIEEIGSNMSKLEVCDIYLGVCKNQLDVAISNKYSDLNWDLACEAFC